MPFAPLRPRLAAAAFLLAVALVAGLAWLRGNGGTPRPVTLHLADRQGVFLVPAPVTLSLPTEPALAGPLLLEALRTPPAEAGLSPVPPDARWVSGTFTTPRWHVTIALKQAPGTTGERLLIGSLVRTLLGFEPSAREVQLSLVDAEGRPLASQHTDLSTPLTLADVSNQLPSATQGPVRTTLWWPGKDTDSLVPVQVSLSGDAGLPAQDALERLVAGPGAEASPFLRPVVPPGVHPRWISLVEGTATVDLGTGLPSDGAGSRLVEAIVLSLTELPEVKRVRFTADGAPLARRLGPYDLAQPVARLKPGTAGPP